MSKFNLAEVINEFNKKTHKKISVNQNCGLLFLSPDGLKLLNDFAEFVDNLDDNKIYRASIQNPNECNELLKELKSDCSNPEFFPRFKDLCHKTSDTISLAKIHEWEMRQAEWLNKEERWELLMNLHPEARGTLTSLRNLWNAQSRFFNVSNDFLLIAFGQIADISTELSEAEAEFKIRRQKIPKEIADQYERFLVSLRKSVDQTKTDLLNTMYCRLYVAGQNCLHSGNIHQDDVLHYLIKEMQHIGVLKKGMPINGYWQTLQPGHFNQFQAIIQSEGNNRLRQGLSNLPWFSRESRLIRTKTIVQDQKRFLIPFELESEFSGCNGFLSRLFRNHTHAHKFLENHQSSFAVVKHGYFHVTPLEVKERFERLNHYENNVQAELKQSTKRIPGKWQLWSYFGYRRLCAKWNSLLKNQAQKCVEERVKLLEQIADSEQAPQDKDDKYDLWLVVRQQVGFLRTKRQSSLTDKLQNRLVAVEKKLKDKLEQSNEQYPILLIKHLAKGNSLKDDEIAYLLGYLENNSLCDDPKKFFEEIKEYRQKAANTLFVQAKKWGSDKRTNLGSPVLRNCIGLLTYLGEDDKKELNFLLRQLVYIQTQFLLKENAEEGQQRLLILQTLIYQHGNEVIQSWMTQSPSYKKSANWQAFLKQWQSHSAILTKTTADKKSVVSTDSTRPTNKVNKSTLLSSFILPRRNSMSCSRQPIPPPEKPSQMGCAY